MAWVGYREALERLHHHLDAKLVRASSSFGPSESSVEVVLRLYPWWEHPSYRAAVAAGEPWGFENYEAGLRDVTVRAIRPWAAHLSNLAEVIEWDFTDSHPVLWADEPLVTIYVNRSFDPESAMTLLLERRLPFVTRGDLARYVGSRPTPAPYALSVPASLSAPVLEVLARLGVPSFASHTPSASRPAVVFLMDGSDHVLADDFEVDIPAFEHDPAWFVPRP